MEEKFLLVSGSPQEWVTVFTYVGMMLFVIWGIFASGKK
jgi:hypothetical protein